MKIKTSELTDTALDWAVARCVIYGDDFDIGFVLESGYTPSTDWAQGGAIIEREKIDLVYQIGHECWCAAGNYMTEDSTEAFGLTPLIAAMRCYVASKLGDEVDVPDELGETK